MHILSQLYCNPPQKIAIMNDKATGLSPSQPKRTALRRILIEKEIPHYD